MSAIDCYKHEVVGRIGEIPIYRLLQDVPGDDFDAKNGDILLGGGSGETPAMRISIPEAFNAYFNTTDWTVDFDSVTKCFWSWNDAYEFITEYKKIGYDDVGKDGRIECWLTSHILGYLLKTYPNEYMKYVNVEEFDYDDIDMKDAGSICLYPTPDMIECSKPIGAVNIKTLTPQYCAEEFMSGLIRFGEATLFDKGIQHIVSTPSYHLAHSNCADLEKFLVDLLEQPVHYIERLVVYIIKELRDNYDFPINPIFLNEKIKKCYDIYQHIIFVERVY